MPDTHECSEPPTHCMGDNTDLIDDTSITTHVAYQRYMQRKCDAGIVSWRRDPATRPSILHSGGTA